MLEVFTIVGFVVAAIGLVVAIVFGVQTWRSSTQIWRSTIGEGSKTRDEILVAGKTTLEAIHESGTTTLLVVQATSKATQEAIVTESKVIQEAIRLDGKEIQEAIRLDGKETRKTIASGNDPPPKPETINLEGRVLIHGAGEAGQILARQLINKCNYYGLTFDKIRVVGFIDDDPSKWGEEIPIFPENPRTEITLSVLGGSERISKIIEEKQIDVVLTAIGKPDPENLKRVQTACKSSGKAWYRLALSFT